jgi:DNA polymerase III delta subunit
MPVENAIAYLRAAASGRKLPPVAIVFGPHAFLREFVLDSIVRAAVAEGCKYRGFQIGPGDDYGALLNEFRAPDLFAPKLAIACRVLRSRRDRAEDSDGGESRSPGTGAGEPALVEALEKFDGPGHLVLLYERDNAPAKVRRAVEKSALMVNCMRPFDNQIDQYVLAFAASLGLKMTGAATDMLISRHGGDIAAIANALSKVTIFTEAGKPVQPSDLDEPGAKRMPEQFELSDSLARGQLSLALAQLGRAFALGRDGFEILALEIIPVMRRMMIAASVLGAGRSSGDVASAFGMPPQSGIVTRAIEGARRFGLKRIERAYWSACAMDAGFKNGLMKEREQALAGLLLELMSRPE